MVAGVQGAGGFQEQNRRLAVGSGAVLNPARDDVERARIEVDGPFGAVGAVAEVDGEAAVDDEEELVGFGVAVPHELARDLDHSNVVVVDRGHNSWTPLVGERGKRGGERNGLLKGERHSFIVRDECAVDE